MTIGARGFDAGGVHDTNVAIVAAVDGAGAGSAVQELTALALAGGDVEGVRDDAATATDFVTGTYIPRRLCWHRPDQVTSREYTTLLVSSSKRL